MELSADRHRGEVSVAVGWMKVNPVTGEEEFIGIDSGEVEWWLEEGVGLGALDATETRFEGSLAAVTLLTSTIKGTVYKVGCRLLSWEKDGVKRVYDYHREEGVSVLSGDMKVIAGQAASFELASSRDSLPADAVSVTRLDVFNVLDQFGNAIDDTDDDDKSVSWSVEGTGAFVEGSVETRLSNGLASAELLASFFPEPSAITVQIDGATKTLAVNNNELMLTVTADDAELWVDGGGGSGGGSSSSSSSGGAEEAGAPWRQGGGEDSRVSTTTLRFSVVDSEGQPAGEGAAVRLLASRGKLSAPVIYCNAEGEAETHLDAEGSTSGPAAVSATVEAASAVATLSFRGGGFDVGWVDWNGENPNATVIGVTPDPLAGDKTLDVYLPVPIFDGGERMVPVSASKTVTVQGPLNSKVKVSLTGEGAVYLTLTGLDAEGFALLDAPLVDVPGIGSRNLVIQSKGTMPSGSPDNPTPAAGFKLTFEKPDQTGATTVSGVVAPSRTIAEIKNIVTGFVAGQGEGIAGMIGEITGGIILGTVADIRDVSTQLANLISGDEVDWIALGFSAISLIPVGRAYRAAATSCQTILSRVGRTRFGREMVELWKTALSAGEAALEFLAEKFGGLFKWFSDLPGLDLDKLARAAKDPELFLKCLAKLRNQLDEETFRKLERLLLDVSDETADKIARVLGEKLDDIGADVVSSVLSTAKARTGLIKCVDNPNILPEDVMAVLENGTHKSGIIHADYPAAKLFENIDEVAEAEGFSSVFKCMKTPVPNLARGWRYQIDVAVEMKRVKGGEIEGFNLRIPKPDGGFTDVDVIVGGVWYQAKTGEMPSATSVKLWSKAAAQRDDGLLNIQWITGKEVSKAKWDIIWQGAAVRPPYPIHFPVP